MLPDTADPSLVDQLTAAVHRMGGQVMPDAAPGGEVGPDGLPIDPAATELPPEEMALGPEGTPEAIPPGMMQAPPMGPPGGLQRPGSLRRPQPAR